MSNVLKYKLKELRLAQKKSARYMATKCQVTEVTYRNWELFQINDQRSPPMDAMIIASKELGVSLQDLINQPVEA